MVDALSLPLAPWAKAPDLPLAPWAQPKSPVRDVPAPAGGGSGLPAFPTIDPIDIVGGIDSGLMQIPADLLGAPRDLGEFAQRGIYHLADKVAEWVTGRKLSEVEQARADRLRSAGIKILPGSEDIKTGLGDITGLHLYKPKTTLGQGFENSAELVGGAALAPGRMIPKLLKFVAAPTIAKEVTSKFTDDPYLQGLAALLAGGASALKKPRFADRLLASDMAAVRPEHFDAAETLARAGHDIGVPLTGAEVVDSASNGVSNLAARMRSVEQTSQGRAITGPFFANRAAQTEEAAGHAVNALAPSTMEPARLGRETQQAALDSIDQLRTDANARARPYYDASKNKVIAPGPAHALANNPVFQSALAAVRASPHGQMNLAHLPDHSIPVLDAVKMQIQRSGTPVFGQPSPLNQDLAVLNSVTGKIKRAIDETGIAPDHARARAEANAGKVAVEQAQSEPIGKIASTDNPSTHGNLILPTNPSRSSSSEIARNLGQMMQHNPEATREIVANHIERVLTEGMQENTGGPNAWGAAKGASVLYGNGNQGAHLEAVVRRVFGDSAWTGFQRTLNVFRATGRRLQPGSPTSSLESAREQAGMPSKLVDIAPAALEVGASVATGDPTAGILGAGKVLGELIPSRSPRANRLMATILTAPDSVQRLRQISRMSTKSGRLASSAAAIVLNAYRTMNQPRDRGSLSAASEIGSGDYTP